MPPLTLTDLATFAAAAQTPRTVPPVAARDVSIWEITTWILPMTPEHLRRVLAQNPDLPQGRVGIEGGTRWFTLPQVAQLRQHFAQVATRRPGRHPNRATGYGAIRPVGARAPLVVLTGPQGGVGRSTSLLHLAVAAALGGTRVLVLDADPTGQLAAQLGAAPGQDATLLPLLARSCGIHLRQLNAGRMDRGEAPLPMDEVIASALDQDASALIRPTVWPGLDIIAAAPALLLADSQIAAWRSAIRSWQPAKALATALDREGLRDRYDLILCDTGRGLGPLVLSVLTSADVLLVPSGQIVEGRPSLGLAELDLALRHEEAEARVTARALGRAAPQFGWRQILALPNPLPHVPQIAAGLATYLYALDYRDVGRLMYAPLRNACDASWAGLAGVLAAIWAEDASAAESVLDTIALE